MSLSQSFHNVPENLVKVGLDVRVVGLQECDPWQLVHVIPSPEILRPGHALGADMEAMIDNVFLLVLKVLVFYTWCH